MEPLTTTIEGTMKALGIGMTKTYQLINEGKLERVRIGRRVLVTTESIRALVASSRDAA